MLFLLGLFFPVKAAQSLGWVGIAIAGVIALFAGNRIRKQHRPWLCACLLMFAAGLWGMNVAPDPQVSWKAFWAYQTIGKGLLCAMILLLLPYSQRQLRFLLLFLLAMLIARSIAMLVFGYRHPVFLGGAELADPAVSIAFRSQGDHILLLSPMLLAAVLMWRRRVLPAAAFIFLEIILLSATGWRGAWLGLAGGYLLVLFLYRAWKPLLLLGTGAIAIGVIGLLASSDNIVAMAIARGVGDSQRYEKVWLPVFNLLQDNGWQGFGFGQARYLELIAGYAARHPELQIPVLGDAHNMALNFAMAAGWFGCLAFFVILTLALHACLTGFRRAGLNFEQKVLLSGTAAGWLGLYGLLGLTDQPHYNDLAVLAVMTSIGIAAFRRNEVT